MVNFADALDVQADSVEAPPLLPVGTFIWEVHKDYEVRAAGDDWEAIEWLVRCVSAEDDVDEDELEAFGDPAGEMARISFMAPTASGKEGDRGRQQTLNSIKNFITNSLQVDGSGLSMSELMAAAKGEQFMAQATHEQDKNNPDVYRLRLKRISAVE
jgi:hypothetical protein